MQTARCLFLLVCVAGGLPGRGEAEATTNDTSLELQRTLTSIGQLRTLARADFNRGRPLRLTATVTLVDEARQRLVLQDATGAMAWYTDLPPNPALLGKSILLECASSVLHVESFPDYPDRPAGRDVQFAFEAPSNWGDYHLTRMAGYLHPPVTGTYTFWIASDNSSELWLSTNDDPDQVRRICYLQEGFWTNPHEWMCYGSQQSEPIQLRAVTHPLVRVRPET